MAGTRSELLLSDTVSLTKFVQEDRSRGICMHVGGRRIHETGAREARR